MRLKRLNEVRTTLVGLLTSATLLACGPTWGAPLPFATPCSGLNTLALWIGSPQCSIGDKNYELLSNSGFVGTVAPALDPLAITQNLLGNGDIEHTVLLTFDTGGIAGPFTASLSYTIAINSLAVGIAGIDAVRFDTTTGLNGSGGATSTSHITPDIGSAFTLNSTDGVPQSATTPQEPQALTYLNTYNVASPGSIQSAADTLDETLTVNIPEPASLALVGLGLSALGFMRRRKLS